MRDVVVLLPGILGSVLQKDGEDLWALSGGALWRAGGRLRSTIADLVLAEDPPDVDDLEDGVVATRLLPDTHLIPGLWKIDGYGEIAKTIRAMPGVEPGANYFELAYDWRRDNRVAARRLARRSHLWLNQWRERSGVADAKLILLGHSMGGLVARYFLECMEGWRDTRLLITFGTPYRGSLKAVGALANGMSPGVGPLRLDLSALVRSLTAVYQLLPVYPCFDVDGKLSRIAETTTIPNVDSARAAAALAFHHQIADAVTANQADEAYNRQRYGIHPIVGIFQPTAQSARLAGTGVELLRAYRGQDQDGDGTVPRVSATPLELSNQGREVYIADRHASLQNVEQALTQVVGLVSGLDIDYSQYYAPVGRLSLDIDDAYAVGEPVTVRVRPEWESVTLAVTVTRSDDDSVLARTSLPPTDEEWRRATFEPLTPGAFRVTVEGAGMEPVHDIFVITGEEAPADQHGL
jgi:pimeloyl-ACP methyl ester carboxylesterase